MPKSIEELRKIRDTLKADIAKLNADIKQIDKYERELDAR